MYASYLFKKIELTSSWVIGGFLEDAAILSGRRKQVTRVESCRLYSSSHSTILNTMLFRFLMLSACGERMYNSTICFHRLRHNQPRKKLWTCDRLFIECQHAKILSNLLYTCVFKSKHLIHLKIVYSPPYLKKNKQSK